ncbi:competence protein CoiA [Planococcus shixiaomingii]|uniref:competence protein CoiA n=1 Tax=Planococcus shixiaomingii TaxID=3058393 RepID=UPI002619793B|nr:competence protein CoiA family protein [Planococcus sp. N022]WKA53724.1 competence protein CoiA family protein [Planococcus sp. N022]
MICILVASTKDKLLFYLTKTYANKELVAIKNSTEFFCPCCGAEVILKIGQIKTPHFAHKSLTHCDTYSEPESPRHLQGKLLLYQFFSSKNYAVELEKYLPEICQRADLLVNRQFAIEYQCSPLSTAQLAVRTHGYLQHGIQPVWIVGIEGPLKDGIQLLKLPAWTKELLRLNPGYIILFSPEENSFYYYSNLFYVSGNLWIGKVKPLSALKQSFPFAVPKKLTEKEFETMFNLFHQTRRKFIASQSFIKNRIASPFWRACYELQIKEGTLPEAFGLPLKNAEFIPCNAVLWQLQVIEASQKEIAVKALIESKKIPISHPAALEDAEALVKNYLALYERLKEHRGGNAVLMKFLFDSYCKSV